MGIRIPRPSLLGRVALSLAAVALLPLAISSFGLVDLNRDALVEQVLRTHGVAAQTAAARVASFLSTRIALARGTAANPVLADPQSMEARRFLAENLGAWADLGVLAVQVATPGGEEVIRAQLRDPAVRERITAALGADTADLLMLPGMVRVTAPLPGGAGLLRLVCDGERLQDVVSSTALGEEAELLVADSQGRVVLGSVPSLAAFPEEMVRTALPGRLSGAGRFQGQDGEVLGAYAPIPDSDWVVMSRQPTRVAEAVAARLRRRSAMAIGAALLLIGALSTVAYGSLVRPIRDLVEAQRRLANLPERPRGGDEIEELRRSFEALERSLSDRRTLDNVFLGRYQVVKPLGTGAMGSVFRGWDPKLQRPVALKTVRLDSAILPDKRRQLMGTLLREAVTLARLSHPHVVPVYDVEDSPEGAFIAMELVEGENLETLLWKRGRLPVSQAVPLGASIARALEAAHANGFVHRDVKPANVLLGRDGSIKVSDFGISELLATTTDMGKAVFGTPGYVPPETLQRGEYGTSGDLFALGAVLYRSLRGIHPFAGGNIPEIVKATLMRPVQPLSRTVADIPKRIEDLVHHLLEKEPGMRPGSAGAVAAELEAFAAAYGYRWTPDLTDDAAPELAAETRSQWISTAGRAMPSS
ncbi:MAG TPA: protein kinase [Thermoanaerobaculia bacterium]|nr:protein kinase [Thermoanaerobaculia bacterium]